MGDLVQVAVEGADPVQFRRRDLNRDVLADYFEFYAGSLILETDEDEGIWLANNEAGKYDLSDLPAAPILRLRLSGRRALDAGTGADPMAVPVVIPGAPDTPTTPITAAGLQAALAAFQSKPVGEEALDDCQDKGPTIKLTFSKAKLNDYTMKVEKGRQYTITVATAGIEPGKISRLVSEFLEEEHVMCLDDKTWGRVVPDTPATRELFWWSPNNTSRKLLAISKPCVTMRERAYKELTREQRQRAVDESRPIMDFLNELDLKKAKEHCFGLCEALVTCPLCMRPYYDHEPLLCKTCESIVGCTHCIEKMINFKMEQENPGPMMCPKCNAHIEFRNDFVGQFTPLESLNGPVNYYADVQDQMGIPNV